MPTTTLTPAGQRFLLSRGLKPSLAVTYGVRSVVGEHGSEALSISYSDERGRGLHNKYRAIEADSERRYWSDQGAKKMLWGLPMLQGLGPDDTLVITEGEFDALSAIQAGYKAISAGSAPPKPTSGEGDDTFYEHLKPHIDAIMKAGRIVIATDGDEKGQFMYADLTARLRIENCHFVTYPEGAKDLNDVLREGGEAAVRAVIDGAKWAGEGVFYRRMSDIPPMPERPAFPLQFPWLGDLWVPRLGDFVVMTGVPGSGKSQLLLHILVRLAALYDLNIAAGLFESDLAGTIRQRLLHARLGCPPMDAPADAIREAETWINRRFLFMGPKKRHGAFEFKWLMEGIMQVVTREDARVVVIDPWNEIDRDDASNKSLTDYVAGCIRLLKLMAAEMNFLLIVVTHPAKLFYGGAKASAKDERQGERFVHLCDISDSQHWYNKADVGLSVQRVRRDGVSYTALHNLKTRDEGKSGMPGTVWCRYRASDMTYEPCEEPPPPKKKKPVSTFHEDAER